MTGILRHLAIAILLGASCWVLPVSAEEAASDGRGQVVGGVYELAIGTDDPLPLIEYLQQYGYRVGESGQLDPASAQALYGVEARLHSVRLLHQDADHGLYRLMIWDRPLGPGLEIAPMKVLGGRWGAAVTRDVYRILNHAEDARAQGQPILVVEPQRQTIYAAPGGRPFIDPPLCVREMLLVRPETRQILFERFGYELALYGRIAEEAPLATSQVTHAGLVVQGGPELTDFYEEALGLLRARDGHISDDSDVASRNIFALEPGERYGTTDFDDVRSDPSDLQKVRSGRLKIVRFLPDGPEVPDLRDRSRPGHRGLTLYTYRVDDLDAVRGQVEAAGASEVTTITVNEFGERSLSFIAPDGYFWTVIETAIEAR